MIPYPKYEWSLQPHKLTILSHGSIIDSVNFTLTDGAGLMVVQDPIIGYGRVFNGLSDYAYAPDGVVLRPGSKDFAVAAVLKTTDSGAGYVFSKFSITSPANQREWALFVNGGNLNVILSDDGTVDAGHAKRYTSTESISDGHPHLCLFTWISDVLSIFIDGVAINPTKTQDDIITEIFQGSDVALIATRDSTAPDDYFNGILYYLGYWENNIPNANQVGEIWNKLASRISFKETFDYGADGVTKIIHNWINITGTWKIGELSLLDNTLKHLQRGQTYLENVTAGILAIPSKQAYGEWEFDLYKGADGNSSTVYIIGSDLTPNNNYSLNFSSTEAVQLINSGSVILASAAAYISNTTWYSILIKRDTIIPGKFYVYIKGGTFGNSYVLVSVTGGSGTNPVTDNTHTSSQFFLLDLDAGDRITNIVFRPFKRV